MAVVVLTAFLRFPLPLRPTTPHALTCVCVTCAIALASGAANALSQSTLASSQVSDVPQTVSYVSAFPCCFEHEDAVCVNVLTRIFFVCVCVCGGGGVVDFAFGLAGGISDAGDACFSVGE